MLTVSGFTDFKEQPLQFRKNEKKKNEREQTICGCIWADFGSKYSRNLAVLVPPELSA